MVEFKLFLVFLSKRNFLILEVYKVYYTTVILSLPILLAGWFLTTLIFPKSMNKKHIKSIAFKLKDKPLI